MTPDPAAATGAPPSVDILREGCRGVAEGARFVEIRGDKIPAYARTFEDPDGDPAATQPRPTPSDPETTAAYWLTLDAINFGSGWFPTLRKPHGATGSRTISDGLTERFRMCGPWRAAELAVIGARELAEVLGQDSGHPLMELFATSLHNLGDHLLADHRGSFAALAHSTNDSAVELSERLGAWACFADTSHLNGIELPFRKRAQIAAADLTRAGVIAAPDLDRLTMFADNLVPHVLRVDGVLVYDPGLLARIEAGALLASGSREEIEIRACALHAVELIAAARPGDSAARIDERLWNRGQEPRYKALPRHRCRCTAY